MLTTPTTEAIRESTERMVLMSIPENKRDTAIFSFDGFEVVGVDALFLTLGDDHILTEMNSWNGSLIFHCKAQKLIPCMAEK